MPGDVRDVRARTRRRSHGITEQSIARIDGMSMRTGQASKHAPHSDDAYGSDAFRHGLTSRAGGRAGGPARRLFRPRQRLRCGAT